MLGSRRPGSTASWTLALLGCLLLAPGCGDDPSVSTGGAGGGGGGPPPPEPLPPLSEAPLTTSERIAPTHDVVVADVERDPRIAENTTALLAEGYGDFEVTAGEAVMPRMLDGGAAPPPGPAPTLVTRFIHLADIQLADDESPARLCNADAPLAPTGSAYRPQEAHECRVLNAAVRTVNRVHEDTPIDLVVLGGDDVDNAQTNEVDWVLGILGGGVQECDSGVDDDPLPGANNDPKDPFVAEGLAVPYLWVNGNHDILQQGNFPPAAKEADYLGDYAATGARDWSQPGGPVILGEVPPDERRQPLFGAELLAVVQGNDDGHGIPAAVVASGRAFYTHDVPGGPVRFIVLDTSAATGAAEGVLHQSDIEDFLIPELDAALADDKLVIVTSHHSSSSLADGSGFGGQLQPDAVLPAELQQTLAAYPNVLMHLAGHSHIHRVTPIESATGTPYWEVLSSALADFPHQMRVVEVWDLDNGYYGIRLVGLDYQTESDPLAEEGRRLGILDVTSGWRPDNSGEPLDRNVELYVAKP